MICELFCGELDISPSLFCQFKLVAVSVEFVPSYIKFLLLYHNLTYLLPIPNIMLICHFMEHQNISGTLFTSKKKLLHFLIAFFLLLLSSNGGKDPLFYFGLA